MRSNCAIWAHLEFKRQLKRWQRAGMPRGLEPVKAKRPSRLRPRFIYHRIVIYTECYETGLRVTKSFVPFDEAPLPWWKLWVALWFKGYVQVGDTHYPSTVFPPTEPPFSR